ncbi:MAG: M48 family metallopeptidase [Eubacteriaceae bacterium]|nr:M48 family metallopeptidase [Eubacteriaceae bacterium]
MNSFDYILKRSGRKSLSISVGRDANVIVRAPAGMPDKEIQAFIRQKNEWVKTKRDIQIQKQAKPLSFVDGEQFEILGFAHKIKIYPQPSAKIAEGCLYLPDLHNKKELAAVCLKDLAAKTFSSRITAFEDALGKQKNNLKLSNARRRWGSCSSAGDINISWRLVLCPLQQVDYVLAHEASHLAHPNHSKAFWKTLSEICPTYIDDKAELANHEFVMDLI